jgi:initiation factor 1A
MVKNDRGGNKTKKQKRSFGKFDATDKLEQGQMFAQITHNHGGSFSVLCSDGIGRLGKLSGYMKKGPRLSEGSYVVVSLRDFESEQKNCDIIAYGDPPNDVISIFKKNDPNSHRKADVEFVDSDDEFKEFEESARTIVNVNNTNTNSNQTNSNQSNGVTDQPNSSSKKEDNFDWGDL